MRAQLSPVIPPISETRRVLIWVGGRHESAGSLRGRFARLGFETLVGGTALDALALFEANVERVAAILFDAVFLERFGTQIVDFFGSWAPSVRRVLVDDGSFRADLFGRLDAVVDDRAKLSELRAAVSEETNPALRIPRRRVLFVDDELDVLAGIQANLRRDLGDWEATWETNGNAALQIFLDDPYDVVVSDFRMPGIDGVELLSTIKSHSPSTRSVILTGQDLSGSLLGIDAVVKKPCPTSVLRHLIFAS